MKHLTYFIRMSVAAGAVAIPSLAQCLSWSPDFPQVNAPNNRVYDMHVHDDGSGLALYVCGKFSSAGSSGNAYIGRFRNGAWTGLDPSRRPMGEVWCLETFDPGSGPKLYIGGWFTQVGQFPLTIPAAGVAQWNGTTWAPLSPPFALGFDGHVTALGTFDDGSGPALYIGGGFDTQVTPVQHLLRWNGSAYSQLGSSVNADVTAFQGWDDGSGPALYVGGYFTQAGGIPVNYVARWTNAGWQSLGAPYIGAYLDFELYNDGSGPALYAAISLGPGVVRWDGVNWSIVGGGLSHGAQALQVFDDGSGPALYAAGGFSTTGGVPASRVAKWDGVQWSALGSGVSSDAGQSDEVYALAVWDDGQGGGPDLMLGGSFRYAGGYSSQFFGAWRGCGTDIESFCSGDGSLRNCPCSNNGAPGRGCAWSGSAQGAWLLASGTTSPDTLMLTATGLPGSGTSTIFLKGDQVASAGIAFGDGLRCVDGRILRLGMQVNGNGAAQYPDIGNPPLSVRGGTPPGSGAVGYYQTYYRNAAPFCTAATFNITNGVRVVW